MRSRRENFVADGPLHSTKRELQRSFFEPRFWAVLAGVSVLLGLIGPFGTYDALALPGRLAYWAATAAATWFVGMGSAWLLAAVFFPERRPGWPLFALFGAAAGLPIAAVVHLLNLLVFGPDTMAFLPLLAYCVAVAAIVTALVAGFTADLSRREAAARPVSPAPAQTEKRPRILDRLPPHLRGPLSHITVQDHYVDIRTDRGGTLVLMRLADAIAETEGVDGLQIHRSHWVAKGAVAAAVRREGRLYLRMKDGTELPVSRSYLAAVRAAGLA